MLRSLVGDVAALWHARETTDADRKRLLRCLIQEVVLIRDDGAKGAGGVTIIRLGWKSGAWTELATPRPSTGEQARTEAAALDRLRSLASRLPDERSAEVLNAEGLTTRSGLPWTTRRVYHIRQNHQIPTGCPAMPRHGQPRGDGLVPLRTAAHLLKVTPGALDHWRRWGFLHAEQRQAGAPVWVRLTADDVARLDGTLAAQGCGQWRLQQAQAILGLTKEEFREKARREELIAYRARVADHWEWRISSADAT
ncbi:MAG: hypothetical protein HY329_23070 [Chloroflexi bacterium]|nr:hypothetical protein [Chloroflexota bacterium]